ncbi:hypothetical protein B5S31_g4616 [[Candida] boidinii]|uniref:Unnamed protein product n=1 Tax=Candida boidinii TaxID=5477 RepID=A0ACB5TZX8_CANBO|nr:hypothetical protein B5S29_g2450 [[Candida] boidinii]OWB74793.1 hypothetical protein B5S31_g4616 [[Candida] boidinii]OWB79469.1 hypothetical protein B5S32_g3691 [[Candida] boidinii]GME97795.1 unnamed protein product [[Candida] boidinii]GME98704.1 unnamed protein product [[Candida] boidinii]
MAKLVHNVQKKQHRERSQPQSRQKWGFLEKKKDYKLRADNYHKKQAQLKIFKEKSKKHNEDEYYHAMTKRHTDKNGVLMTDRGNEVLDNDEVLLLKTQDTNYLNTLRTNELSKIKKSNNNLLNFVESNSKHTIFVNNKEEQTNFNPAEYFNTDEKLINKKENRLRVNQLIGYEENENGSNTEVDGLRKFKSTVNIHADEDEDGELVSESDDDELIDVYEARRKRKQDEKKLKELKLLQKRMEREQKLLSLTNKLELQKNLMKKGEKKKTINKNGKTVFKWKNVRKR